MKPLNFDASEIQVDAPIGHWCASGHCAPENFKEKSTRFFLVQAGEICGIYCELCLIVANYISKMKKDVR